MTEEKKSALDNWGKWVLNKILHPFTVVGTPLFLLILLIYFIIVAFASGGVLPGVRSFAGGLLPLIAMSFIFVFKKDMLRKFGKINVVVSFFISLVWGGILMFLVELLSNVYLGIPMIEIVLSASFSVLVFSYVSLYGDEKRNKVLAYYYGIVSGFLIYIIIWGFPLKG